MGLNMGVVACMNFNEELILVRDTTATVIPAGEEQMLPAGTRAVISQALGGTVTIRTDSGLFRLASKDWDAFVTPRVARSAVLELTNQIGDGGFGIAVEHACIFCGEEAIF